MGELTDTTYELIKRCAYAYHMYPDQHEAWPAMLRELASQHNISTGGNDLKPGFTSWLAKRLVCDGHITDEEMAAMCGLILLRVPSPPPVETGS